MLSFGAKILSILGDNALHEQRRKSISFTMPAVDFTNAGANLSA